MKIQLLLIVCCFACSACSIVPVKPWKKGTLASETMRFGGPNPMIKKFDEHIYTSKEGSKGGNGVSGGGCGCN
ncbi:MAG: DUF4266 domain-containing protein [Alteromonadales bacterium]|nr:DUF4266 domain-containing protein [Alteromonadales bacterium]MCP4985983.1 DUF4266 domain-containing protein [Colwellia sp.]